MDISVIIATHNSQRFVGRCLASLGQWIKGLTYEVIVVDNCSADGTRDLLQREHPQVHLIANSINTGFARANNRAAALAHGDYLFLLNADTELSGDGIDAALHYVRENRIAILGPRTISPAGTVLKTWSRNNSLRHYMAGILAGALFLKRFRQSSAETANRGRPLQAAFLTGSAILIDRQAYQNLGLFDERFFFSCEERDLCMRYTNAGLKLVYFPGWSILHHVHSGNRYSSFHYVNWIKSSRSLARKHGGLGAWALMVGLTLLCALIQCLAVPFKYMTSRAHSAPTGWAADRGRILLWCLGLLREESVLAGGRHPVRVKIGS